MLVVKILYIRTSTEFDLLTIKLNRRQQLQEKRKRVSQDQNQEDRKGEERDKKYTEEKKERKNDEEGDIQQEKQGRKCSEDVANSKRNKDT